MAFCSARLERAVDRHHLAGRLHLRAERAITGGELVEGPAGDLDDAVVEGWFKGGGRALRDAVRDLVEALAGGNLRGDPGDRVARCLRRERGGTRNTRIDLDHVVGELLGRLGVVPGDDVWPRRERELHVAAALDAQRPDDLERAVAERLVLGVGERLRGCDDDRVAGVDAHRVEVLYVADRDAGVVGVPHHLVLQLLPAEERAFNQDLGDGRRSEAGRDERAISLRRVRDTAACATERVGGTDHRGQADLLDGRLGIRPRLDDRRGWCRLADGIKQVAETLAVLGELDRLDGRSDQSDIVFIQHPCLGEGDREVEAGLAAQGGQQSFRALAIDDALEDIDGQRLDVNHVGNAVVGHDRRRIGVDEDGADALLAHGLAGLRTGVIELGSLPDHNRTAADDEHRGRLRGRGRGFGGQLW